MKITIDIPDEYTDSIMQYRQSQGTVMPDATTGKPVWSYPFSDVADGVRVAIAGWLDGILTSWPTDAIRASIEEEKRIADSRKSASKISVDKGPVK